MDAGKQGLITVIVSSVLAVASFVAYWFQKSEPVVSRLDAGPVRCLIELKNYNDTSAVLITGFNYHLLKEFALDRDIDVTISLSDKFQSGLDSLKHGNVDILVLPFNDSKGLDSVLVSHPVDSQTVWVFRGDWKHELSEVNHWIRQVHRRDNFNRTRASFMKVYSPFRSRPREMLSPYDSLIRQYADSIGWDWRMMAAVIYQESHFHIEAQSHRGARGLMQMMPSTADTFGAGDLLDPEESIRAGAKYLEKLSYRYNRLAANRLERDKFVLAAYNAGGGRIRDCIIFARSMGIEPKEWNDIVSIIPHMQDSSTIAAVPEVKLGTFKGVETINYVNRVLALYNEFCRIAPKE